MGTSRFIQPSSRNDLPERPLPPAPRRARSADPRRNVGNALALFAVVVVIVVVLVLQGT